MNIYERYTKEMDSVQFSGDFERNTVKMLRDHALKSKQSPKGENIMRITEGKKLYRIAAAAAAFTILLTGTVYAAKMLLTPSQVAHRLGEDWAAQAFESDDAIEIGETQRFGDYLITLDGIAAGKALSAISEDVISGDAQERSYAVFTVTRADGQPMKNDCIDSLPFMLTPIVNGIEPWKLSIFQLDASVMETASDGARYILMETESLEKFADRGVRIVAYEGFAPDSGTFAVLPDGTTGFAESYNGEKVIFDLPLDPAKADPEEVRQLIERIEAEWQSDTADDLLSEDNINISDEMAVDFTFSTLEPVEADIYTFVCGRSDDSEVLIAESAVIDHGDSMGYSKHAKQLLEQNGDYAYVRVYKGSSNAPENFIEEFSRQN